MSGPDEPLYPIRTVSSLTGVTPVTLRAWERRYGLVRPQRTDGGQRLYSHSDVRRLADARSLIACGVPPSRVGALLDGELPGGALHDEHARWRALCASAAEATARMDRAALRRVLSQGLLEAPVAESSRHFAEPLLRDLGLAWQSGDRAGEQRLMEAELRSMATRLEDRLPSRRPLLLAACLPGETHEAGLGMLAVLAAREGLALLWLGRDLPFADLERASRRSGCRALVLHGQQALRRPRLGRGLARLAAALPVYAAGTAASLSAREAERQGARPLPADPAEALARLRAEVA